MSASEQNSTIVFSDEFWEPLATPYPKIEIRCCGSSGNSLVKENITVVEDATGMTFKEILLRSRAKADEWKSSLD